MSSYTLPIDDCAEMWMDPICPGEMYDLVPDDYDPSEDICDIDDMND